MNRIFKDWIIVRTLHFPRDNDDRILQLLDLQRYQLEKEDLIKTSRSKFKKCLVIGTFSTSVVCWVIPKILRPSRIKTLIGGLFFGSVLGFHHCSKLIVEKYSDILAANLDTFSK